MKPKKQGCMAFAKKMDIANGGTVKSSYLKINNLFSNWVYFAKNLFDEMHFLLDKSENLWKIHK